MKLQASRLKLPPNTTGTDYVVGDIHGHVTQLLNNLEDIGFNKGCDRLICVGDLIDRGPESIEAIELLDEPWFYAVMGNHEYLMLSGMRHKNSKDRMVWLKNGGEWVMHSAPSEWEGWLDKIETLPVTIEVSTTTGVTYGIVHADFPGIHWDDFERFDQAQLYRCIWSRSNFNSRSEHRIQGIDYLFHGHCISDFELKLGNRYYIEPGVFLGNDFIIKKL